ncbi:hypothetical protein BEWA_001470 [Theileria equi strain WA]|uniref:Uncharacterized protein n=1 Tax=Theileria equi strain WA TaxID=1537102 RepID=L0AYU5_THEEQ|nr:hypothetical protein BEWA_001470 [Theileria equi strain WA]AFZ80740.1 hypothetical protein BEWA_001470 [Theileria equi strain WA]|eukprot:XP_004830406.1 hypothetical protein BEWA_001470 [Theileria equi strain WA]
MDGIKIPNVSILSDDQQRDNDFIKVIKTTHLDKNVKNESTSVYHFLPPEELEHSDQPKPESEDIPAISIARATRNIGNRSTSSNFHLDSSNYSDIFVKDDYISLPGGDEDLENVPVLKEYDCISIIHTTLYLGLMLISLLVPAIFHAFFQFRLYGLFFEEYQEGKIIDCFGEFENFFVVGVLIYIAIQLVGFNSTHNRFKGYLCNLCKFSMNKTRRDFMVNSKQEALEKFKKHVKSVFKTPTSACVTAMNDLAKGFDEASYKFTHGAAEEILDRMKMLKFKIFFMRIWFPFILHLIISLGTCAYVYDWKFRSHYRVPLAHPKIVSGFYWYAALQYEGFWCILITFIFNLVTWFHLCRLNEHKCFFASLDSALVEIDKAMSDYAMNISKEIWESQMLVFVTNAYPSNGDNLRISRNLLHPPTRNKTLTSQINISTSKRNKYPCLCQLVSNVSDELEFEGHNLSISVMDG